MSDQANVMPMYHGSMTETISEEFAKYLLENFRRREDESAIAALLERQAVALETIAEKLSVPSHQTEIDALRAKVESATANLEQSRQNLQGSVNPTT